MSPIPILFVVVLVQVVLFQFVSVRLARALPDQIVGVDRLADEDRSRIRVFRASAGRGRFLLGGVLAVVLVLAALVLPLDYGTRKVAIAAVSIVSSLALGIGMILDRRRFARITEQLPAPEHRFASLRPRRLTDYVPAPAELLPVAIIGVTILWTFRTMEEIVVPGTGETVSLASVKTWVLPAVQVLLYGFLTFLAASRSALSGSFASAARAYTDRPAEALERDERQRGREIRYFFWSKSGVVLLLGFLQIRRIALLKGSDTAPELGTAIWILVLILFALFLSYLLRIPGARREAASRRQEAR
ncbi:MAG: hypothetical protein GF346_04415 [Candidatus Eisenbacteria bacterium]|nr:hypothetical protein [Candidatus Latescibacterota bacterium]MBD3301671.1 hypothetical protein [Candidatus Eisenbacteria bacterium]